MADRARTLNLRPTAMRTIGSMSRFAFRSATIVFALSVGVCAFAQAGPYAFASAGTGARAGASEGVVAREIAALIAGLGASGCEFQRNGTWYDAAKARSHLQRKYDYLRKRDLAPSAESFIERAATRSSLSGQPYRVRCPQQTEMPAADWFLRRLRALRSAPTKASG